MIIRINRTRIKNWKIKKKGSYKGIRWTYIDLNEYHWYTYNLENIITGEKINNISCFSENQSDTPSSVIKYMIDEEFFSQISTWQ